MAQTARQYTTLADDDEILTEIQHFGGSTNQIDFTEDYLIALFFASVKCETKDGRVVLHWPEQDTVVRPRHTINRIVAQRSFFIRPRRGFIVPDARDETVVVPSDLKGSVLSFLERFHGISERTVFNDIHGFIGHQTPLRSRYAREFRETAPGSRPSPIAGLRHSLEAQGAGTEPWGVSKIEQEPMCHAFHQRGMVYGDAALGGLLLHILGLNVTYYALDELEARDVVDLFALLIEGLKGVTRPENYGLRPEELYCGRGEAHLFLGSTELAMRDFNEALDRDAEMAEAYHGRSNAHRRRDRSAALADCLLRSFPNALSPDRLYRPLEAATNSPVLARIAHQV